jgi:apolipoprotein N-acyltransferase
MVLARLWGGFPWNLLGVSQQRIVPLIQVAAFTGVYGVSFCVAWGSVALLCAGSVILRRPHLTSAWMGEIILPLTVILVLFAFGFHQMAQTPVGARELKVTLVQPSIPQTLIWDPAKGDERFQELIRLSESALANPTDLLVWPEAAIPKLLRWDRDTFQAVTNLAVTHHVWMIVGSDDAEPARYSNDPKEAQYFNSSFLVSPSGILAARYGKRQLVIFGEYVPLERWLPFVKWFTPIQGSFTPGQHPVQFAMTSPDVTASVLICFEDVFGRLARESASPNTDFLVNLTNDGWFGESAAQWQHAANASFRAVENGRPLIRCTNTGLTCWYDACGRLRELFRDGQGSVYGSGFLTVTLPLPAAGEERPPTFYNRHGDWFGWGCAAVAGVALAGALVRITRVEKTLLG